MKIGAMVLCGTNEPFIGYCLESIKDLADEIYCIVPNEFMSMPIKTKTIVQNTKETNFAAWRNQCLEEMRKDGMKFCLFVDADEVFANSDGTPVTRIQLDELINRKYEQKSLNSKGKEEVKEVNAEVFDFFTRHFLWNYFTIDARQNGVHYSDQRLFKLPEKPIECKYEREVHEVLTWGRVLPKQTMTYFPVRIRVTPQRKLERFHPAVTLIEKECDHLPMLWHFADLKGMEDLRKKYEIRGKIPSNPFNVERKGMDNDKFCAQHPKFTGQLPVCHYAGKLPECLRLW